MAQKPCPSSSHSGGSSSAPSEAGEGDLGAEEQDEVEFPSGAADSNPPAGLFSAPPRRGRRFKGVRQRRWGRVACEIRDAVGKRVWLGSYDSDEQAARVYDAAARVLQGRTAWLNFPGEEPVPLPRGMLRTLRKHRINMVHRDAKPVRGSAQRGSSVRPKDEPSSPGAPACSGHAAWAASPKQEQLQDKQPDGPPQPVHTRGQVDSHAGPKAEPWSFAPACHPQKPAEQAPGTLWGGPCPDRADDGWGVPPQATEGLATALRIEQDEGRGFHGDCRSAPTLWDGMPQQVPHDDGSMHTAHDMRQTQHEFCMQTESIGFPMTSATSRMLADAPTWSLQDEGQDDSAGQGRVWQAASGQPYHGLGGSWPPPTGHQAVYLPAFQQGPPAAAAHGPSDCAEHPAGNGTECALATAPRREASMEGQLAKPGNLSLNIDSCALSLNSQGESTHTSACREHKEEPYVAHAHHQTQMGSDEAQGAFLAIPEHSSSLPGYSMHRASEAPGSLQTQHMQCALGPGNETSMSMQGGTTNGWGRETLGTGRHSSPDGRGSHFAGQHVYAEMSDSHAMLAEPRCPGHHASPILGMLNLLRNASLAFTAGQHNLHTDGIGGRSGEANEVQFNHQDVMHSGAGSTRGDAKQEPAEGGQVGEGHEGLHHSCSVTAEGRDAHGEGICIQHRLQSLLPSLRNLDALLTQMKSIQ